MKLTPQEKLRYIEFLINKRQAESLKMMKGDILGHKWDGTKLILQNPDGSWDNGIDLKGVKGDDGLDGEIPAHKWEGTRLSFQNPDGTWGDFMELGAKDGVDGKDGKDGKDAKLPKNFKKQIVSEIQSDINLNLETLESKIETLNDKHDSIKIPKEETPETIKTKLESLDGEDRLDKKSIKGLDKVIIQEDLDRAISILDNRTQYLINKNTSGITSLSGLTGATQTLATGTSGTDFNISSSGTTHTFNIPTASASNRGLLSTSDWSTFNGKVPYTGDVSDLSIGNYAFIGNTLKAYTSAGIEIQSSSGSVAALFGAGGGQNTTFYDGVKLDAGTASRVLVTDASKNISYSSVTDTELGYLSGVTSAIQTQIDAKFTLPALASGSVLFSDGSTITQNNTDFYWDDTNKQLQLGNGTAALPSFTFKSDPNTGIYGKTTDSLGFSVNGTEAGYITSTGVWNFVSSSGGTLEIGSTDRYMDFAGTATPSAAVTQTVRTNNTWSLDQNRTSVFSINNNVLVSATTAVSLTNLIGNRASPTATGTSNITISNVYAYDASPFTDGMSGGATVSITNEYAYKAGNMTGAATLSASFYSDQNSGSGKWALYMNGSASNYMNGSLLVGTTSADAKVHFRAAYANTDVLAIESVATNDDPKFKVKQGRLSSTGAGTGNCGTIDTVTDTVLHVEVTLVARQTGGASGTPGDGASYKFYGTFKNVSGTVTQIGTTTFTYTAEDVAAYNPFLDISGTTVRVRCQNPSGYHTVWHSTIFYQYLNS